MKKYRELKKREVQMDEFLENFEQSKSTELENLASTRKNIVGLLESIGKVSLIFFKHQSFFEKKLQKVNKRRYHVIKIVEIMMNHNMHQLKLLIFKKLNN